MVVGCGHNQHTKGGIFLNLSQFAEQAIFVFGSNRRGFHGAGAALFAVQYRGAPTGQGEGVCHPQRVKATRCQPNTRRMTQLQIFPCYKRVCPLSGVRR